MAAASMKVALLFLVANGINPDGPIAYMFGRYSLGGFLFFDKQGEPPFCFLTMAGGVYKRFQKSIFKSMFEWGYECLLIPVDEEEGDRILRTCDAVMQVKKPYNLKDIFLMHVPFREVEDPPIDKAPTLHNAQAIILILRECLRQDNRLREGIAGLNSRQTMLDDVLSKLQPLCAPVTVANMQALIDCAKVDDRQGNPTEKH